MSELSAILMILTGILVGLLGGMFGFGGSSISTPFLRMFFLVSPYQALASPLPMTLLSSSISAKRYQSQGFIDWKIVRSMIGVMIIGSFLGAYVTKYLNGEILMFLTAIFLIYIAIRFIFNKKSIKIKNVKKWKVSLSGFFIGLISGILANGGGILIVPILTILGLNIKKAIGTSMALVFFIAIPSILVHWYLGHINWWITLYLTIGAIPGAYIGAYITVKLKKEKLKKLYGVFLLLFSIYFAFFEFLKI